MAELIDQDNRLLLCVGCGAVFEDVWSTEGGSSTWDLPTCPYCRAGWYRNTEEKLRTPTKKNYKLWKEDTLHVPAEGERYIHWYYWLESRGVSDDKILHQSAMRTAQKEATGQAINQRRLLRWAQGQQARDSQREAGSILPGEDGEDLVFTLDEERGEVSTFYPMAPDNVEEELIQKEAVTELQQTADEVWAQLQKQGRWRKWGADLTWEEAAEVTYPGKDAPADEQQRYNAIRHQVHKFRERMQERLDEHP